MQNRSNASMEPRLVATEVAVVDAKLALADIEVAATGDVVVGVAVDVV